MTSRVKRPVNRRRVLAAAVSYAAAGLSPVRAQAPGTPDAIVFAAASLKTALDLIGLAYQRESGSRFVVSYGGSPALARQIEQGAPADIFISADEEWMEYLATRGLVRPETRRSVLGNRLVLITPAADTRNIEIVAPFDLAGLLGPGRLAMAQTTSVPAGKYGRAALQSLGAWDSVKDKLAETENVRVALSLVARGEAPFGIVYATDAQAEPGVRVAGLVPAATHPAITYPFAITTAGTGQGATAVFAFLTGDRAREIYTKQGFTVL